MNAGVGRALDRLSFRRITDIPFETYWAVLEKWQCIEHLPTQHFDYISARQAAHTSEPTQPESG
jgi:hypothetical protein